jgi:hypothetical protein
MLKAEREQVSNQSRSFRAEQVPGTCTAVLSTLGTVAPEADLSTLNGAEPVRNQVDLDSVDFPSFIESLRLRLRYR